MILPTYIEYIEVGIKGSFVYIAYASDGTGTGFTMTNDPDLRWSAILISPIKITAPVVTDFAGLWREDREGSGGGTNYFPDTITSETGNVQADGKHTHELGIVSTETVVKYDPDYVSYGALYNWPVTVDSRKISSSDDWDILTHTEQEELRDNVGGETVGGGHLKEVGYTFWNEPNVGAVNDFDFNARGSSYRLNTGVFATTLNIDAIYWSKTEMSFLTISAWYLAVDTNHEICITTGGNYKEQGNSIRLSRDATESELLLPDGLISAIYTGNDGKTYGCTKIGSKIFIVSNLNETQWRDHSWIEGFNGGVYTPIPNEDWASRGLTGESLMCYHENNKANGGGEIPLADLLISEHNKLKGLDGGDPDNNFFGHLTEAELAKVQALPETFLAASDIPYDIDFEFTDFVLGTAKTYTLDLKAKKAYTIEGIVLETDTGTFTGISVKIGSTAVTSLSSLTATTLAETASTGAKTVALGDRVTINLSTGYTGTPTTIRGKLLRQLT